MGEADLAILHNRLVAQALDVLSKPAVSYPFAVPAAADELVKDLKGHPHAYVIACVMDRQTVAEKACSLCFCRIAWCVSRRGVGRNTHGPAFRWSSLPCNFLRSGSSGCPGSPR